jgi:hypothetical protein
MRTEREQLVKLHEGSESGFPVKLLVDRGEHLGGRIFRCQQSRCDRAGRRADETCGLMTCGEEHLQCPGEHGTFRAAAFKYKIELSHEILPSDYTPRYLRIFKL